MKYMGSKNRISKELVPIIQSYIDKNNIDGFKKMVEFIESDPYKPEE